MKAKSGYIYLIKCGRFHKIGKASDVLNRLQTLQTGNPYKLKIIHTFKAKDYSKAERLLHARYNYWRRRGEWFELNENQIKEITRVVSL